jgi:hypothetical protein
VLITVAVAAILVALVVTDVLLALKLHFLLLLLVAVSVVIITVLLFLLVTVIAVAAVVQPSIKFGNLLQPEPTDGKRTS